MQTFRLGKTDLTITRTGFGALPIQRRSMEDAVPILQRAYEAGITFFDTARGYTDSEKKIGEALGSVRNEIVIATKSGATTRDGIWKDLETSLRELKTDWVDLLQLHNPKELPDPENASSSYAALMEAKEQGVIHHIGITNHKIHAAKEAIASGLYESLQFPLSAISDEQDLSLIALAREVDMGVIAMKALCGGLLTNIPLAFSFLRQYDNVVPIWGIQRMEELEEFLRLDADPPVMDEDMKECLEKDRQELSGEFCRGCGYCLPCPADIPIPMAARMSFLLRRAPAHRFLTQEWLEKMQRIEECQDCGACAERCPYGLDPRKLLPGMLEDYETLYADAHR